MKFKQKKTINFSLATLLLCLANSTMAENRALLIGIEKYAHVSPPLTGPVNDVRNIKKLALDLLGYKKSQITTLLNKQATKHNILESIKNKLIAETNAGDQVLFYFSGHGYQIKDTDNDEKDHLDETLVSYDAAFKKDELVDMVTDDDLRDLFDQITDRKVTIIVDSCHSGSITRGLIRSNGFIKSPNGISSKTRSIKNLVDITDTPAFKAHRTEEPILASAKNRVVWSAVTAGQKARIDQTIAKSSPQQSVFTRWFIDGLKQKNADINHSGSVSYAELLAYTRKKSKNYCQKRSDCANGLGLTPTLEAPDELLSASVLPASNHSQFTDPPEITEIANEALPVINQDTIKIDVEVSGKSSHKIHLNDKLYIQVISEKAGYLLLLDQNANGELRQIYPNNGKNENRITAGKAVYIPKNSSSYTISATERGQSQLIAIVTHDKVELSSLISATKDLAVIAKPKDYLNTLAERLQSTWVGDRINRSVDYSLSKYKYTVER